MEQKKKNEQHLRSGSHDKQKQNSKGQEVIRKTLDNNQNLTFPFPANIMYSSLGMADSEETRNSSRSRGAERREQQQAEQNQGEEQEAVRGMQDEAVRRRIAENGYAGSDGDAGFTEEWAQQRDQRLMRRQGQVRSIRVLIFISFECVSVSVCYCQALG